MNLDILLVIASNRNNSLPVKIALAVIGCIALIIIVKSLYDYSLEKVSKKSSISKLAKGKIDKNNLKRIANKLSLSDEHFKFLLHYCKLYQINKLSLISDTEHTINAVLKKIYLGISENVSNLSVDEIENKKHTLFMIITNIELAKRSLSVLTSTLALTEGLPISYITGSNTHNKTRIIENNKYGLCLAVATSSIGELIKPAPLSSIRLYFELTGGIAYMIETQVIRYQYRNGKTELVLMHSNNLNFHQKRKYRRKNVDLKAVFQAVDLIHDKESGKKTFSVRDKKYVAEIVNISAGGCRLRIKNPIKAGQNLQISSILETGKSFSACGIIINLKKNIESDVFILYILFIRMNKQSQNAIFEFIYDYVNLGN